MNRLVPILVLIFMTLPVVAFVGLGAWTMWEAGFLLWIWWLFPLFWGAGFLLARWWQSRLFTLPGTDLRPASHWTPQDEKALEIVAEHQRAVKSIDPEKLTDPHFYVDTARELAMKVARHYHPRAADPLGSLTVLEILTVTHLASEELEVWVQKYLPGSHLLTVNQWRTLGNAPTWFRVAGDVSWLVSMLIHPVNIGRYIVSKLTMDTASAQVQENILAWFYVIFTRHVGYYVIEMNSGRLRGGTEKYRSVMNRNPLRREDRRAAPDERVVQASESEPVEVTVAVVGQVKAGKSSLVNALLGERRAATDVLPATLGTTAYRLDLEKTQDRLVLLDTTGYGVGDLTARQLEEIREAFRQADVVLLVLRATSPAREPDLRMLREMKDWFARQTHLRPPPVLAVLTHIDGLSPMMEWSPPYDWQSATREKERQIQGALHYTHEQFGESLAGAIPVCADVERGRQYGTHEWLLPAMTALLDDARACGMIRTLHHELDRGEVRRVFTQFFHAGHGFLRFYLFDEEGKWKVEGGRLKVEGGR